jgi:hypothetical protein
MQLREILPFACNSIETGLNYLGFELKSNSYSFDDWLWLIKNNQARISSWAQRWLSRGGRLVLLKVVLNSIVVHWETISKIPK